MIKNISVIGLGKLGLSIAVCFAEKGFKVIGVDVDSKKIKKINNTIAPTDETGLANLLKKVKNNLEAVGDYAYAISNTDISFIAVATPSSFDGSFSNKYLEQALLKIGQALREKNTYHVIVITSTIMPQTTENITKAVLEKFSGKKCGKDFGIIYNPAFIALGSIIRDFLNPDFILIGQMDKRDGNKLVEIYKKICENNPRFARMSPLNAEITKLALNCYITTKITFANSLSNICERVKGADADTVCECLGLDSRIGAKFIKPGLGYGGPCFPRDNLAFSAFAKKIGAGAELVKTVAIVNRKQPKRIFNQIKRALGVLKKQKNNIRIGVLGLSYKPNTSVIDESQALSIVKLLIKEGYSVKVYDPKAQENAKDVLKNTVRYARNVKDCFLGVDLGVIAVPWKEFKKINFRKINKNMILFNCWRRNGSGITR